ncbi:hypothetical protein [Anaerococcus tetradius]|jgi:hypothetical protein|uniref:hypothetical protein n=1 Tax=Anaerococcus tetradius TaxID=33036 RepID=UPI0023F5111A|nr:hypothetical protein [Anaerococcus tetradius]
MKNRLKNILVTLSVGICFLCSVVVGANGYKDVDFNFDFSTLSGPRYTVSERKDTTSPAYAYVKHLSHGRECLFSIVYADKSKSYYTEEVRVDEDNIWYCISSNVVEDAGPGCYVRLRGDRLGVGSMNVSGWWSADSHRCEK